MLFKILHGDKARISTDITPYHEGYCYVTYNGDFYVDMNDERVKLNAKDAETITGKSLDEIKAEIQVHPDWKQTDENAPDYIKNKLGLELGEAEMTTQQPGSLAISKGATAFGENTFAGLRAFTIVSYNTDNKSYTLSSSLPEGVAVGTVFSAQIKNNFYNYGAITGISDDRLTITADNYIDVDEMQAAAGVGKEIVKQIWFVDYPTVGDTNIGDYAFSAGAGTKATQEYATAIGRETKAVGKYSAALGRETEAHYAAFAAGYKTKAIAEEAIALGYESEASGKVSAAIGKNVRATQPYQTVVGAYNADDDDALFIVGKGTSNTQRSNAFTVNKDGSLNTEFEPILETNLTNKRYVDSILNSTVETVNTNLDTFNAELDNFGSRLSNLEAGYITNEYETAEVTLPDDVDSNVYIGKISGYSREGLNKANPKKIQSGYSSGGAKTTDVSIDGNNINITYHTKTGAVFAFYTELETTINTDYTLMLNVSSSSIQTVWGYTTRLWDSNNRIFSKSITKGSMTFNSGNNTKIILGFYIPADKRSDLDIETVSDFMIAEGSGHSFEPYILYPTVISTISSCAIDSSVRDSYTIPTEITNLTGYGYSGNTVDFINRTYSYVTENGIDKLDNMQVISLYDIIDNLPSLDVQPGGTIVFGTDHIDIPTSILYKKYTADSITIVDNLSSTNSNAALSANMGRQLNEKMAGYINNIPADELEYDRNLSINLVNHEGVAENAVLTARYIDMPNLYQTEISAAGSKILLGDSSIEPSETHITLQTEGDVILQGTQGIQLNSASIKINGVDLDTYIQTKVQACVDNIILNGAW